jgi:integrase/recombinase XerD
MRNDSFSIRFYSCPDKKTTTGEIPIYTRITINRQKTEISTRLKIKREDDWDALTQRVKIAKSPINMELSRIAGDLVNLYNKLKHNNEEVTSSLLKDKYLGVDNNSSLLIKFIDQYFTEQIVSKTELSDSTVKNYRATINHIKAYLEHCNKTKITLRQINEEFVRNFDRHLLSTPAGKNAESTLMRNSVNKYLTKLKAMLNYALEEGLIERSPFRNIKLKEEQSKRTFLTRQELDKIEAHSLGDNLSLRKVRDIFMFSVYTGLRFGDAMDLKAADVELDGKKYWILFRQRKTKEVVRLPMLKRAAEIYENYLVDRTITGYVLPRITNQKVNAYLKTIGQLVGLSKPLTHHVARHTNATTIFLANGASLEVVSKQLGHSSLKSTQIYAKITNDMLSKTVDKIDKILK